MCLIIILIIYLWVYMKAKLLHTKILVFILWIQMLYFWLFRSIYCCRSYFYYLEVLIKMLMLCYSEQNVSCYITASLDKMGALLSMYKKCVLFFFIKTMQFVEFIFLYDSVIKSILEYCDTISLLNNCNKKIILPVDKKLHWIIIVFLVQLKMLWGIYEFAFLFILLLVCIFSSGIIKLNMKL